MFAFQADCSTFLLSFSQQISAESLRNQHPSLAAETVQMTFQGKSPPNSMGVVQPEMIKKAISFFFYLLPITEPLKYLIVISGLRFFSLVPLKDICLSHRF